MKRTHMKRKLKELAARAEVQVVVAIIRSRDFLLGFLTCFFMFAFAIE